MSCQADSRENLYRSVEEALAECEREFAVRERCFGKWVEAGKLTRVDARDRLERMRSACFYLTQLDASLRASAPSSGAAAHLEAQETALHIPIDVVTRTGDLTVTAESE